MALQKRQCPEQPCTSVSALTILNRPSTLNPLIRFTAMFQYPLLTSANLVTGICLQHKMTTVWTGINTTQPSSVYRALCACLHAFKCK